MPETVTIVDYGMGNLRSVQKAFQKVGAAAEISSDPAAIEKATRIVLPGVGAFGDAVKELRERELFISLQRAILAGKRFLGICLGFQLLFESSEESPGVRGLAIFRGQVLRIPSVVENDSFKVPHMGWNNLEIVRREGAFKNLPESPDFYFVHSYYVYPADSTIVSAYVRYGVPMCASIYSDGVTGYQFHPEKSQVRGLELLHHFTEC
ncbi:MAG: imidazole glycerol phosphate synthase subunit HisH [Planctomycetes bacterium]|nr:imidazole glycerol phosphate synthase subunit HisH [Planctomycetota bacterium]